ncbi:UDP-glycosyltransferase UGT5-like [Arctopsyche grandis]|uniref:UDP-glycosyltransferase UGT5-like n=1 Tax=Arctopsyche grandis TaxID=121162 RepID=UPI00406D92E6
MSLTCTSNLLLLCCLLATIFTPICGYKILTICPLPARSHNNLCRGVVDALVERGHEVTLVSAFAADKPKFRDFPIRNIMSFKEKEFNTGFAMLNQSKIETIQMISTIQPKMMKFMYEDKAINKFLSDKSEKFDLVIFEYFLNEAAIGYGVKYDCPVIALSPVSMMTWLTIMTNNPLAPEIVPNVFSNFGNNMNLWQRVANVGMNVLQEVLGRFMIRPIQKSIYEEYFPEESKRVPFDELTKRISLVLVNSHPSIGIARPLLPNAIEIAGYHIKDPESLPDDLKTILDSAKEGVVYFSMGSNLKSSQMSPELKAIILKALGNLKQTVLWKYEEDLPGKPKNVVIRKWMPQTGILAHPNVKLFISHGGFLSCTEATHFGVPLLAIPIFGDQSINARAVVRRGHGVVLDYMNITDVSFKWALDEVLENPRYTETAKQVHQLYHDRPMRPSDLLVYNVEHVIRTKGAPHLSPPQLSRCSQLMLDVIGIILIPLLTIGALFSYVFWRCCCRKKKQKTETVKSDKKQKKL